MKQILVLLLCAVTLQVRSQDISRKLAAAVAAFEADPQMRHAIMSICVVDAGTGKPVYAHHEQVGLAAASVQKILTSGAAFELLGASYRYKTMLGYSGKIEGNTLKGYLNIIASGDPTLGSWRYRSTSEDELLERWTKSVVNAGIKKIEGPTAVLYGSPRFEGETIPDGWIWQDIGNYYGAGASFFNWRENQYDLYIKPGKKPGDSVRIVETRPSLRNIRLDCKLTTGAAGSGDNAYIYLPPYATYGVIRGTVPPVNANGNFVISGSLPNPVMQAVGQLEEKLLQKGIGTDSTLNRTDFMPDGSVADPHILYTHYSPALDSINYWFLRRSINLYGEALIKTIALVKRDTGSTEKGVELVKEFWSKQGIDKAAINIVDGSGLSPQNRVTTDALVKALRYAKGRNWYESFYKALPQYNGMTMKSGSIGGARAYAGYHRSANGKEYAFAIIVNNYDGSSGKAVRKLYRVLDILKK